MSPEVIAALVGGVAGAVLSCMFAVLLRNADKWKLFQEDVGVMRARFLQIEEASGITGVSKVHRACMNDLTVAVCRIQPYVGASRYLNLLRLLDDYRSADHRKDTGFLPADLAGAYKGRPGDCFTDPQKAVTFLLRVLDEIVRL